jgi:hypothetical protein
MKDSGFAGWLLQRNVGKKLTLGGEIYAQSAQAAGGRSTTFIDGGGYYYFTPAFQLLFMLGHTVPARVTRSVTLDSIGHGNGGVSQAKRSLRLWAQRRFDRLPSPIGGLPTCRCR